MAKNNHSLPHLSDNGWHLNVYSFKEGTRAPKGFHQPLPGPIVNVHSIEALRQRLNPDIKGY